MSTAALVIAFIIIMAIIIGGFLILQQGIENPNATPSPSLEANEPAISATATPPPTPSPAPSPTVSPTIYVSPTPPSSPPPNAGAIEFDISAINFTFDPNLITVHIGQKVKINFHNKNTLPHNLTIEGLGISTKTIDPGHDDTIEFTAPGRGNYTFSCSIPGHKESGMTGAIRVE